MLGSAHEGYEYQDYFTVAIALDLMLNKSDVRLVIDRKDFKTDKFDDLKVVPIQKDQAGTCYQIKYSNEEADHALEKADFSYGNNHDTCITDLFASWKDLRGTGNFSKLILCLAWRRPSERDELQKYLLPGQKCFLPFSCLTYYFDGRKFWPEGESVPSSWRKVKKYISENEIDREQFIEFCDDLIIELELPKSSLDYDHPLELENYIKSAVARLGVGVYPNDAISDIDIINRFAFIIKVARARGGTIEVNSLADALGLITNYGKMDQKFPVDRSVQVLLKDESDSLYSFLNEKKKVILSGSPGSGKSWLIEEFTQALKSNDKKVIRYSCFISPEDDAAVERIKTNSLYGNLIYQLLEQNPELKEEKRTLFGADKEELERLLRLSKDIFYIIVDGLDHIDREYELNKNILAKNDTEIIKEITEIQFPDNCCVLIISQPISELDDFRRLGYADFEIKRWEKQQIVALMGKYQIEDGTLNSSSLLDSGMNFDSDSESDTSISTIILNKSQGNALYISYLMRQFQGQKITAELFKNLPDYDADLLNYYEYLYSRVRCSQTVIALCGAEFYLNENELQEITGIGNFVKEDLSILHPVLRNNLVSGGVAIYHESFRRFILKKLKDGSVDIPRTIYGGLIVWLENKPFYKNQKSYYYLPSLYLRANDNDIINIIKPDFVVESIKEGYARQKIRNNIIRLIYGAAKAADIVALATAAELLSMLEDLNDVDDTRESYLVALADVKGADKLKNLMQVDGRATMSVSTGLKACYICSRAGVNPWWDLYIDTEKRTIDVQKEAKYYFRNHIDKTGIEAIPRVMRDIENKEGNTWTALIEEIYPEIENYIGEGKIQDICRENGLLQWEKYIDDFKTGFTESDSYSEEEAASLFDQILSIKYPTNEDALRIEAFYNAEFSLDRSEGFINKKAFFHSIIKKCESINWFHNWLIYYMKIVDLWAHNDQRDLDSEVLNALAYLATDMEVFKGKPRACDLYSIRDILDKSYILALKMLRSRDSLKKALDILSEVSEETITWLDSSSNGPLTNDRFIKVLNKIINTENSDIVIPYLENCINEIAEGEAYDYTVDAAFSMASILSTYCKEKAEEYYNLGISYLVGYGYHKDTIIDQIIDSYQSYYGAKERMTADTTFLNTYRDSITAMTFALFDHTDGRATNHYLNVWIDVLLETEPIYAVGYISGFQLNHHGGWITNGMIRSLVRKYCGYPEYCQLIAGLIKSLPNDMSYTLIDAASSLLEELLKTKDSELSHCLINELVVNILSRYDILDDHSLPKRGSSERESIERFVSIASKTSIDIERYEKIFGESISKERNCSAALWGDNTDFAASSYEDAIEWLGNNDLTEKNTPSVLEYLKSLNYEEQLYECFKTIIFRRRWDDGKTFNSIVIAMLGNLDVSEKFATRIFTLLFLNSSEWGNSLNDSDMFFEAYNKNADVAFSSLYEELPLIIVQRSGRTTAGLINALNKIGGFDEIIVKIWENVLEIMQLRFPNLKAHRHDIAESFSDERTGLIAVLTGRMIDGGKEQFLSGYSFIADQTEDEAAFLAAISYGIKHFAEWNYVTKIAFVQLIRDYGGKLHAEGKKNLIEEINGIYPSGNILIDLLLSGGTVYTDVLKHKTDKHIPDIYEQEDIEFYLKEKLPDLGKISETQGSAKSDYYAENCIYRDSAMWLLKCIGADYKELYIELHNSEVVNKKIRKFAGAVAGQPEMNTEYKSYVLQYAQHLILKKAYRDRDPFLIQNNLLLLVPDYSGMYLYVKSREVNSGKHIFDKKSGTVEAVEVETDGKYRRIATFEVKRDINYKNNSMIVAYEGLVTSAWRDNENTQDIRPVNESLTFSFPQDAIIELTADSSCLIDVLAKIDKELEGESYLWPSETICRAYGLQKKFDMKTGCFCATDPDGNDVFRMRNWRACYKGNSDYSGNAIPSYFGVELIASDDFIKKIESDYGKLYSATKIISLDLNLEEGKIKKV
ncbi:MAG: ATP-binding protein [Anaerolactibacter massiliensis]|nr:ATP-binding protein [Anaerolactibacter massiliensis]